MYFIVKLDSLNKIVTKEQKENLIFSPLGQYISFVIFEDEGLAIEYFNKINLYISNYSIFSHREYILDQKIYRKNDEMFFKYLLDSLFESVDNMFLNEFSKYGGKLLSVDLIVRLRDNVTNLDCLSAYVEMTEKELINEQEDVLSNIIIKQSERKNKKEKPGILSKFGYK